MLSLVPEDIEKYAVNNSEPEGNLLTDLTETTYKRSDAAVMISGPSVGNFLSMLIFVTQSKRVLEIGTFVGYSALIMARSLPTNGELITLDVDVNSPNLGKKYWDKDPAGKLITFKLGKALETMDTLEPGFDLIFIDADKRNYANYYEKSLNLLSKNGIIVIDNVLWSGKVLDPQDKESKAINDLNKKITSDQRVKNVLLTVRDGLMLIRKVQFYFLFLNIPIIKIGNAQNNPPTKPKSPKSQIGSSPVPPKEGPNTGINIVNIDTRIINIIFFFRILEINIAKIIGIEKEINNSHRSNILSKDRILFTK